MLMGSLHLVADLMPVNMARPILESKGFAVGALYGAFGFLATGILYAVRRRTREGGGIAFAAATFLAVRDAFGADAAPFGVAVALIILAVGGSLAMRMRSRISDRWYETLGRSALALVPGAIVLAVVFPLGTPAWLRVAVGTGAVVAGALVHDFDSAHGPRGAPFVLVGLAALSVYFTVPDTELPLVMLGVALPLVLLSFPQPLRRLGPAGTAAAMGAFAWVVVVGGRGRPGSVVAGIATLGLLLAEPLGRRVPKSTFVLGRRGKPPQPNDRWAAVIVVAGLAQLAMGAFCSTIAGREPDALFAGLMVAAPLVILGAFAPFILPLNSNDHRTRRPPRAHRRRQNHQKTPASH